jgi:hypothetical protein
VFDGEIANVLEADWVHAVEGAERAFGIPPFSGQRAELLYLGGVDGGVGHVLEIEVNAALVKPVSRRSGAW